MRLYLPVLITLFVWNSAFAQEVGHEPAAEVLESEDMSVVPTSSELVSNERTGNGDVIALGVVSGASIAGSIAYLIAASNTRADLDAVEGTSFFDQSEERRLDQQESSQSLLGYTLLGVGVATAGGFTYLLLSRRDRGDDGSVALTPLFSRRFQGVTLRAEF